MRESWLLTDPGHNRLIELPKLGIAAIALPARRDARVISGNAMRVRILSCENGGEGRPAQRSSNVASGVSQGFACQLVKVGGLYVGVSEKGVVSPRLIIRDDEENVGRS